LTQHPKEYARVQAEVDGVQGPLCEASLAHLPITLRVFKEALRMYPPVYIFSRQACRDTSIDGFAIPKHTAVTISALALHRRPDLWPDPDLFKPDRFLPEEEAKRPRLSWLPFGAGPRVCIGAQFALMEGQLVLAHLLRSHTFESLGPAVPYPSATLRPQGLQMRITARNAH
jgi:cytochrome P450